jgi:hypothetical protein
MPKSMSMRHNEVTRVSNNQQAEDKFILQHVCRYHVHDVGIRFNCFLVPSKRGKPMKESQGNALVVERACIARAQS